MNPRVDEVKYESPYKLVLTFTNREVREFDFRPYLTYPVYEPLQDEAFCHKVKMINGTVSWDSEIDFDPDTLYLESKLLISA